MFLKWTHETNIDAIFPSHVYIIHLFEVWVVWCFFISWHTSGELLHLTPNICITAVDENVHIYQFSVIVVKVFKFGWKLDYCFNFMLLRLFLGNSCYLNLLTLTLLQTDSQRVKSCYRLFSSTKVRGYESFLVNLAPNFLWQAGAIAQRWQYWEFAMQHIQMWVDKLILVVIFNIFHLYIL